MQAIKNKNNTVNEFFNYYSNCTADLKGLIRFNVIKKCGFSYSSFYYKMRNGNFSATEITVLKKELNKSTAAYKNII